MKKLLTISLVAVLGGFVLGGCWIDNDIANGDAFRAAFPDEDTLTIQTEGLNQGDQQQGLTSQRQALVGDRADLHDLSFAVAFSVNFHARNILDVLWFITRFQPTQAVEEDGVIGDPGEEFPYDARAIWGPFPDDEGKNLEFILHVWRGTDPEDGRRTFLFFVAGRPQGGTDADWVPLLVGGAKPFEGNADRFGLVQLDFDAIRSLDPTEDDMGVVTFVYAQDAASHVVAATGEGIWDEEKQMPVDIEYFYGRSAEGYAILEFNAPADIDEEGGTQLEDLHITTGWLYNGDGRSDAVVTGGDLGADGTASLTECWGADHLQTYYRFALEGMDPDVVMVEDGQVSACFLPEALVLDDIDYEGIRNAFD